MKIADVHNLSTEELKDKVLNLKKELMQLRFQAKTGKLERQNLMRRNRRSIARILTVINQRKKTEVKP